MLSVHYDLTLICVDSFLKLCKKTALEDMEGFFERLNALSEVNHCNFVLNVSADTETLPEFVKPFLI